MLPTKELPLSPWVYCRHASVGSRCLTPDFKHETFTALSLQTERINLRSSCLLHLKSGGRRAPGCSGKRCPTLCQRLPKGSKEFAGGGNRLEKKEVPFCAVSSNP